jgi:predicted Fe-S protein YdhL (DUF1289 family)
MTAPPSQPAPIVSPCIKVCVLDSQRICVGCGRSVDEIARWSQLSPGEQREIVALAARRQERRSQGLCGVD